MVCKGLLLLTLAVFVSGCATMGGAFDTTVVPGEKRLVDVKEDPMPPLNDLVVKYVFQQSKGDSWLTAEVQKVVRQTTIVHNTYETQDTIKKSLKSGKDTVLLTEWIVLGVGGVLTAGTFTAQPGQPDWGGNVWTPNEITQDRAIGLGIMGLGAIGLIVDYINLGGGHGDVQRTTSDDKKENVTNQGACGGCTVKLDLGSVGRFVGKTNADGRASFDLSKLGVLASNLNSAPWGQLVTTDGSITAKTDVLLDPDIKEKQETALEQRCLEKVNRLMDSGKWQEAYENLQSCGSSSDEQGFLARLRGHLHIGDKETAYNVYPPLTGGLQDLILDPASLKGKVIEIPVQVLQKISDEAYLVSISEDKTFYLVKAGNSGCPFDFVSNQPLKILAEVVGSYTYVTALNSTNTVTKLKAIWVQSFR